ncbi:MAG: bifunctional DNA-formamidopyrimidine glycosylase/DNA-(apurinic or apyrimidinic site) lyase [Ilumatobacteraceae bacterium]
MPELPEVETVRRGIERHVVGRRITRVEVGRERTVRRTSREAVIDGLSGTTVVAANRRGKYLLCPLDSGEEMMIHLRMSGRVLVAPAGSERPPHTHVVLHLQPNAGEEASEMWFVDPRTFGEVVVFDPAYVSEHMPDLVKLGVDPLVDEFTPEILRERFARKHGNLKATLLDQHVLAGIGNIYADEIMHRAKLRWSRVPASLSMPTLVRLHEAIVHVLSKAVEAGGSTLDDTQYVDIDGEQGWFQTEHRVYGRGGEQCLTCNKARISRTTVAGRTTCYCAVCQK